MCSSALRGVTQICHRKTHFLSAFLGGSTLRASLANSGQDGSRVNEAGDATYANWCDHTVARVGREGVDDARTAVIPRPRGEL